MATPEKSITPFKSKTLTVSKPCDPVKELASHITNNPSLFNATTPQKGIASIGRALNYFRQHCIKTRHPLSQAPFIKLVCKTLSAHNNSFQLLIQQRGGVDKFVAATSGAYAAQSLEPDWIKATGIEDTSKQYAVSFFIFISHHSPSRINLF